MNSNKKCFYKAYITIPELSYWCSPCALKTTISIDKDDNEYFKQQQYHLSQKVCLLIVCQ